MAQPTFRYPIWVRHIYLSPGHNYFGHEIDAPGQHPTHDAEVAQADVGQGLCGDRFYGLGADFDGQVTFFAWEVFAAWLEHSARTASPSALRRNLVVEGVPLNLLIGQTFAVNDVTFLGVRHCAPCRWMDAAYGDGARAFLKGRGGLRAQVVKSGSLRTGVAQLTTSIPLQFDALTQRLPQPRLP